MRLAKYTARYALACEGRSQWQKGGSRKRVKRGCGGTRRGKMQRTSIDSPPAWRPACCGGVLLILSFSSSLSFFLSLRRTQFRVRARTHARTHAYANARGRTSALGRCRAQSSKESRPAPSEARRNREREKGRERGKEGERERERESEKGKLDPAREDSGSLLPCARAALSAAFSRSLTHKN